MPPLWHRRPLPLAAAVGAAVSIGSVVLWLGKETSNISLSPSLSSCNEAVVWLDKETSNISPSPSLTPRNKALLARILPDGHADTVRVRRVAASLILAARKDEVFGQRRLSERIRHHVIHGIKWRVRVIDDKRIKACSHPSGVILVSTGFLETYCQKDTELATLLSHEVAHVITRHSLGKIRNLFWVRVLANFMAELLDAPVDGIPQHKWLFLFMRPYLFSMELEADRVGLILQAAAGYNPHDGPLFYEKLKALEGQRKDTFVVEYCTHPPLERRAAELRQEHVMGEAMKVFNEGVERRARISGLHPNDGKLHPNLTANARQCK